jgi:hypothetical protein
MPNNRPDPGEFLEMAQRMLRELFNSNRSDDDDDGEPWAQATRSAYSTSSTRESRHHGPSAERQRENLTFALATRAVEALEDLALNVAAIRQRLERAGTEAPQSETGPAGGGAAEHDAAGE